MDAIKLSLENEGYINVVSTGENRGTMFYKARKYEFKAVARLYDEAVIEVFGRFADMATWSFMYELTQDDIDELEAL